MFKSKAITRPLFCLVALISVSKTEAALLVSEREIEIESQKAWEQMKTSLPVSRDLSKRTQVNCIAKKIIRQLDEPFVDEDWEIEVFENPGVNAFAMPGGKLGVYTGLFSVASNQDELATVIGHEIAHVTEKHSYEIGDTRNKRIPPYIHSMFATTSIEISKLQLLQMQAS